MKHNLKNTEHFTLQRNGTDIINLDEGVVQYGDEISTISDFNTTGLVKLSTIYTDLSLQDIHGNLRNSRETANCYVVSETGYYMLPLVYGNAIKNGEENISAYSTLYSQYQADFVNYLDKKITSPYIEMDTGNKAESARLEISDSNDVIEDIEIKADINESVRFLCFRVISVPSKGGNVILSILDDKNRIMWSWHIWLWSESLTPVTITNYSGNNYSILPVNLGSKYDSSDHLVSWYYQWGRKDPLLCASAYNSSNNHTSYGESSFNFVEGGAESVGQAIQNPTSMYQYNENYYYNWVQLDYFFNFWDATCGSTGATEKTVVKTVYDPCPPGYSIPNARVFTGFTSTGSNTSTAEQFNKIGDWTAGWYFKKNSSDTEGEFFPASGYRYYASGGLTNVGGYGLCWSAGAHSSYNAYFLRFNSGNVRPLDDNFRAGGFSVRPFLE